MGLLKRKYEQPYIGSREGKDKGNSRKNHFNYVGKCHCIGVRDGDSTQALGIRMVSKWFKINGLMF